MTWSTNPPGLTCAAKDTLRTMSPILLRSIRPGSFCISRRESGVAAHEKTPKAEVRICPGITVTSLSPKLPDFPGFCEGLVTVISGRRLSRTLGVVGLTFFCLALCPIVRLTHPQPEEHFPPGLPDQGVGPARVASRLRQCC